MCRLPFSEKGGSMADQIIVQRTRNVPWVGIGAKGEWDDYREALRAAGLDFNVYAQDVFWERPDRFTLDEIMASPDPNASVTYLSIMESNLAVLQEALR